MLSKKENLLETIKGGKPDRFVNQFSYLSTGQILLIIMISQCHNKRNIPPG